MKYLTHTWNNTIFIQHWYFAHSISKCIFLKRIFFKWNEILLKQVPYTIIFPLVISSPNDIDSFIYYNNQGWGQIRFIKYKYKYKYIFFRSFKYKYKYKYTGKNLIKYKYKYSSSNTNTNTNTQWGRDKIAAILQMTYQNLWYCNCLEDCFIYSDFTENCFQRSNLQ